jgi:arylsulfatase A-like enzyme
MSDMIRRSAWASLLFLALSACATEDGRRPNIIYILADDMGIGDVAAYNAESRIATPSLDQLAAEGMRFTDAHTNSAVCTPTRYGILTGRYAWRSRLKKGVLNGHSDHLIDLGRDTVASLLQRAGYATAAVGKWHLGMDWQSEDDVPLKADGVGAIPAAPISNGPNEVGFDYYFGISASLNMSPHAYIENDRMQGDLVLLETPEAVKAAGLTGAKIGWFDKAFRQDQVMTTFFDKSIDWIRSRQADDPDQPFFLYLPLNAPHSPIVPREEFTGASELSPHGDFVMEVDHHVGRLMAALESLGIDDDTLVIFTADNGVSPMAKLDKMQAQGHYSSGPYRGLKGSLYEGGHRVPFIARWPGVIGPGRSSDYHLSTTDLMATVADIVNTPLADNAGEDSVSFLAALEGGQVDDAVRGGVVYHSDAGFYSIRDGRWKLVLHEEGGTRRKNPKDKDSPVANAGSTQLFDMSADPTERVSVAHENQNIVQRLAGQLQKVIDNGRSTPGPAQHNEPPEGKKPWAGRDRVEALTGADARPNIVLLMADDLGYGDTGFNGNETIKTPSLDQMAADGVVMTNFHAGAPVCSPTRGTALTGRHAFRYGIYSANTGFLRPGEITIPELLLEQGYATGHFGKWHLGTLSKTISSKGDGRNPEENYSPPEWHGYERSFVTESAVATWNPAQGGRAEDNPFWDDGVALDPEDPSLGGGAGRVVMDSAIPFIRQAVADGKPFFSVIWFHAPHAPVVAGPDYLAMYEGHGEAAHYYGAITEMDEQIGRLRAELEALGVADNTFITFTSDNGPEGKEVEGKKAGVTGGLRGRKRSLYEGGVRVPTVTVWPGRVSPGTTTDVPTSTLDYLPTVLDILNIGMPDDRPIDGVSMMPLLNGTANTRPEPIPFWHKNRMALIQGNLKLVMTPDKPDSDELYDLGEDVAEEQDIAAAHEDVAAALRIRLEAFAESARASDNGADYPDGPREDK